MKNKLKIIIPVYNLLYAIVSLITVIIFIISNNTVVDGTIAGNVAENIYFIGMVIGFAILLILTVFSSLNGIYLLNIMGLGLVFISSLYLVLFEGIELERIYMIYYLGPITITSGILFFLALKSSVVNNGNRERKWFAFINGTVVSLLIEIIINSLHQMHLSMTVISFIVTSTFMFLYVRSVVGQKIDQ